VRLSRCQSDLPTPAGATRPTKPPWMPRCCRPECHSGLYVLALRFKPTEMTQGNSPQRFTLYPL